jgi:hypothetical protein
MQGVVLDDFEKVIAKGEVLYDSFVSVRCPYFSEDVHFNARGLEHLKFKRRDKVRPKPDQYMRFKLLHLAPEVLKLSRTVQGCWETRHFERVRVRGRTDTILKQVAYYEFVAVLRGLRVKVIVKQVETGQKFFWSIIPFWGVLKRNGEAARRKMHGGNPEED